MRFYLGAHMPRWLERLKVPLFVSRRRLVTYKQLPRAAAPWALDSGGFTELSSFGRWTLSPEEYVEEVHRYRDEVGGMEWAAIQDWMCEPWIIQKTGLSVEEHQRRTLANYERLLVLAPALPWTPVLQGWSRPDYLRHLAWYRAAGHRLERLPVVGVGSVCRRQASNEAGAIVRELAYEGLRLHGFGFKINAFVAGFHRYLASSDSMAWSAAARREPRLEGCSHRGNCANCARLRASPAAG